MTRVFAACLLMAVSLLALACSGARINPSVGDEVLFNQGLAFFEKKSYKKAIEYFKELTSNYPESNFKREASLLLADAYFASRQYDEAADGYQNFRGAYPTHPKIPYAVYRTGLSHFQQMGTIDRDQSGAQKAVAEFQGLLAEFPSSDYATEGREKLNQARAFLARREFYVGEFYYRQGKYNSALGRFYTILEKYKDTELAFPSLLMAAKSHMELGETELARDALTVLANSNPRPPYASEVKSLLARINSAPAKGNEKKGLLAKLNPLTLFRSNAKEKEIDAEDNGKINEETLAKRKAVLVSYGSELRASVQPSQKIESARPSRLGRGREALEVRGNPREGEAQKPPPDGQPLTGNQRSESWFHRLFGWLGL